jgi:mannan endo-1,4-beta-mannosidase
MVERWGGSGVVFAWDLWNEMHPAHMGNDVSHFATVATELSEHVRALELRIHGRAHPQTISLFGPILDSHPRVADTIFRHPLLDFASTHLYAEGTIDHPRNTVDPAVTVGRLVREALSHTPHDRPYLDSEHGPIHSFKDKKKTLPEPFDDEYFRHIQWAHMASGAAGGGMRWPNRRPHTLTVGMRRAQSALAGFLPLIDWSRFRRRNLNQEVRVSAPVHPFACADGQQAVVWLLRTDIIEKSSGRLRVGAPASPVTLELPGMKDGSYVVTTWNTREGRPEGTLDALAQGGLIRIETQVFTDVALAIRPE